jgi:hypothetical protein
MNNNDNTLNASVDIPRCAPGLALDVVNALVDLSQSSCIPTLQYTAIFLPRLIDRQALFHEDPRAGLSPATFR